jgi:plasmid stability protein
LGRDFALERDHDGPKGDFTMKLMVRRRIAAFFPFKPTVLPGRLMAKTPPGMGLIVNSSEDSQEERRRSSNPFLVAFLCYKWYLMDTTVRNLDERAYRALRARAVLEGRTVGELISEAIRGYLKRSTVKRGTGSLRNLHPEPYPEGNEQLSSEIDTIVYGAQR